MSKCVVGPPTVLYLTGDFFYVDLCSPGMICKLDCLWLSPYLFVSLGEWLIISREQPVLAEIWGYCWEPGGTHLALCPRVVGCVHQEYAPVMCRDFAPGFTPELISCPSDLVNRCRLLSAFSGGNVSSLCVPPGIV